MLTKHHVYVEIVKDITPRNLKRKTLYQDNTKTKKISNAPPPPKKNSNARWLEREYHEYCLF